ncbi:alpha/beta hydrolase [Pseudomonas sp. S3E17]|uniref:alpha/beta hydrolase n=1 Tax=Pseudomonas sp. S3E17 TaxID=2817893 RepID=UPI0020A04E0A|nr:alpha/beta hydrolase [Pseudomonas sp. S3E17]MCP1463276.1 pimeloyl-ACP methyl ester carboxylesterase [Pseudomonas sp. S3E17]
MFQRMEVSFPSEDVHCAAWLYLPDAVSAPPVIVMAHGLGGIREMRLDAFAERFCEAGYACLVFDYRNFGASEGKHRQLLDISSQQEDWRSAVAYVRRHPALNPEKIILWGSSFSGGHALHTAAADNAIAAVIAQCPFTDGLASLLQVDLLTLLKLTILGITDMICATLGLAPVRVKIAGPKGSAALMTAPDAESGYLKLVPDQYPFKNYVCARFALKIGFYRPGKKASSLCCPVMFCVCDNDSVAPAAPTLRYAGITKDAEIYRSAAGHFGIYVAHAFEQVVEQQISFLKRRIDPQSRLLDHHAQRKV